VGVESALLFHHEKADQAETIIRDKSFQSFLFQ